VLIFLLSAVLLADTAPPATAAPPAVDKTKTEIRLPAAAVAGVVPQGQNDQVICRKELVPGSRFFKTVCEQKSVADERRRLDQQQIRQMQDLSKNF
jgi:hypothetical protein